MYIPNKAQSTSSGTIGCYMYHCCALLTGLVSTHRMYCVEAPIRTSSLSVCCKFICSCHVSLSRQVLCRAVVATGVLTAQQVVKNEHGEEVRMSPNTLYVIIRTSLADLCMMTSFGQVLNARETTGVLPSGMSVVWITSTSLRSVSYFPPRSPT